jgi:DNA-binding MarR family transcriptional regulator
LSVLGALGRYGGGRGSQTRGRCRLSGPITDSRHECRARGKFNVVPWTDSEPRWLSDDEQRAWRTTLYTFMLLRRQMDRDLQPYGISLNDYEILVVLSEAPGKRLRMTELADATVQSRSRLSHQITRMEARGMVRREECEGDKRGTWTVLTESGQETIERLAPIHVDGVRRHFLDRMTPAQLQDMRMTCAPIEEYLRKIRDRD